MSDFVDPISAPRPQLLSTLAISFSTTLSLYEKEEQAGRKQRVTARLAEKEVSATAVWSFDCRRPENRESQT